MYVSSINQQSFCARANKANKDNGKPKNNGLATFAGITVGSLVPIIQTPLVKPCIINMSKLSQNITTEELQNVNNAISKVLKDTGLAEKGVKCIDYTKTSPFTFLSKNHKMLEMIADGKNACFNPRMNEILVNNKKFSLATFHELGHAFNFNNTKFWKVLQKLRIPGIIIASGLAIFAACTRTSKPKDGEELTKGQKAKNFIRNNAGKLAFLSALPMVAEETMASIRGCKWANKMLNPALAKKVLKVNIMGGITYLATAVTLALGAVAARKVKDVIQAKKDAKAVA